MTELGEASRREHEERVAFCLAAPAADLAEDDVRLVLEKLPRGPEGVFDVRDAGGARIVAALVERAENHANAAELVVLGVSAEETVVAELLARVVDLAHEVALGGARQVLHVWVSPRFSSVAPHLEARGFAISFSSYQMQTFALSVKRAEPIAPLRFVDWSPSIDARVVHDVVSRAFAAVPGTMMMSADDLHHRLASASPPVRILLDGDRVAGVCRLRAPLGDGVGFVRQIAREPELHGRGLGDILLWECQRVLAELGATRLGLEVVANNARALALYEKNGFAVRSVETTWARPLH